MVDTSGWVIVAIPDKQDRTWRVSSEKVPHMTLLYLGDIPELLNESEIGAYLNHVAETSARPFGLSVDRRDVLGENNADVLLFEKSYMMRDIMKLRSDLLQNDAIHAAYSSAEQYPEFTPHLTLGYPDKPAKKHDDDWPISYVNFNTLALWTGDYSGLEFPLKQDILEDELIMSDRMTRHLKHYGVMGMKWGRRKNDDGSYSRTSNRETDSEDFAKASAANAKIKRHGTRALTNEELQAAVNRMNLEQQYSRLNAQSKNEGSKFAQNLVKDVGKDLAKDYLKKGAKAGIKAGIKAAAKNK